MPYIPPDQLSKAREMDLLTYLRTFEPEELVHFSGGTYCTRTHDSLKISNGKWYWFSRGFGGATALDYLIQVKGLPLPEAVTQILGHPATATAIPPPRAKRSLRLPEAAPDNNRVISYLTGRGLDGQLVENCIRQGLIYESLPYHNAVFVGRDRYGKPRYAHLRSTAGSFKGEAPGSDKRYAFRLAAKDSDTLHLFESAIDLLSFVTLEGLEGRSSETEHLLSLAGVYQPREGVQSQRLPLALSQFLTDYPNIRRIVLRLDNDPAGRGAAEALTQLLSDQYEIKAELPRQGKDYNDLLCLQRGIFVPGMRYRPRER